MQDIILFNHWSTRKKNVILNQLANKRRLLSKITYITILILPLNLIKGQSCSNEIYSHFNFSDIRQILINNNCQSCHQSSNLNWHFEDFQSFISSNSCISNIVTPGDAGGSGLIQIMQVSNQCIPNKYQSIHALPNDDLKTLESWINFGAPEYCIPLQNEIVEIFQSNNCTSCHSEQSMAGGIDLESNLPFGQVSKVDCSVNEVIKLYDSENSSLLQYLINQECSNDEHYESLTENEISKIKDWISAGAPQNATSLPLELVNFDISLDGETPKLFWNTRSEVGVYKFIIERSDASGEFITIGETLAKGEDMNSYTFEDNNAADNDYYYRIKILDFDGRHEYSPIEYVRIQSIDFIFNVFPNPTIKGNRLIIKWYSKNNIQSSALMKLVNSSGQEIKEFPIIEGLNHIDLPEIQSGLYYLSFVDYYGGTHFERIIISDQ